MSADSSLPSWPRKFFEGAEQDAFLFYVVHGSTVENLQLSRSRYRCNGIPDGIDMMTYGPTEHPEVVASFREGYLWDVLQSQRPALANDIAEQAECIVVRGTVPSGPSLNYFRDTIGLLTALLDSGGVAIYDPQSFVWWSPEDWKARVFEPASPQAGEHVSILVSEDGSGREWFHTRGLRKFGRPDISLRNVPAEYRAAVEDLFNRLIDFQAHGGVIKDGQQIRIQALPEGMVCTCGGHVDDPDFNNTHIEILWPSTGAS